MVKPGGRQSPNLAVLATVIALVGTAARAESAQIFRLPAEPLDAAIIRFAVQAGVSIGGVATDCEGTSRPVVGMLTPTEALRLLLPPGCSFERVDSKAYRIVAARRRPLIATPAPTLAAPSVAELIVTAEKRREPLTGSPFAVSALTGDEIERLGARSFADIALQFPGVAETNLGPGRNKIFIRGISDGAFTGRTQSTVGLYLDDVPITYNAPDPDLRLADVERVEVLRGPQGTLYGSGSIGGIVRIVTTKPNPARLAAQVVFEGMLNEPNDLGSGVEAMLNVPLLNGRAAVRLVGYLDESAGYLTNPILGLHDVNHGQRSGLRLTGLLNLADGWQAEVRFSRQSIKTADSQYTHGGRRLSRDAGILEPHDNDFHQVGVSVSRVGSAADIRISGAYVDHDLSTRYDATGAFDLPRSGPAAFDEGQRRELWVGEAVATTASAGRLRWLGGVFGSYAQEESSGILDATLSGGAVRSVFMRRDHLTEAAAFGELTYDLTPQLTATVGGRLFATRVETHSDEFMLAWPPLGEVRRHLTDEGFSPKLRLSYAFRPDVVLYAQLQDGYRAGGFNLPPRADGSIGGPDIPSYRPDRLRSYELGGDVALFQRSITLRAAIFRADWRNVQTDQFQASGLPVTLNIGDGSNFGLEIEAVWRPDLHWQIRINGLVDDPQLTRSSDVFPARVDIGLPGVAKFTASMDARYRWRPVPAVEAELSAQLAYVGRSYLTFDGAAATAMGGYGEGRIMASVRGGPWQVQAYVANVTDESGNTFAFGNPFSRSRSRQETPLPPRAFGLAIRRRF